MGKQEREQLVYQINDLDCQINYLMQAIKLDMLNTDEEYCLNTLIVKRAHFRKELETLEHKTTSILNRLKCFSHQPKRICDYFH